MKKWLSMVTSVYTGALTFMLGVTPMTDAVWLDCCRRYNIVVRSPCDLTIPGWEYMTHSTKLDICRSMVRADIVVLVDLHSARVVLQHSGQPGPSGLSGPGHSVPRCGDTHA